MHQAVQTRIVAEIDEDLTNHEVSEIEKLIAENA